MKLRINNKTNEIILAIFLLFCYLFNSGNYNLLWVYAGIVFLKSALMERKVLQQTFSLWLFFVISSMVSAIATTFPFNIEKNIVALSKIFLCCVLMYYFKRYGSEIRYYMLFKILIFLILFLLLCAMIFPNSRLWSDYDAVNLYVHKRLQLFCMEPSQLGFLLGIISIFVIYNVVEFDITKWRMLAMAVLIITFILASPQGAILSSGISIIYLIGKKLLRKKISILNLLLGLGVIIAIILLFYTNNSIMNRVIDMFNGNDGSFNGRVMLPIRTFPILLQRSHWMGIGFGNMNTPDVLAITKYIYSNSFFDVIASGGLLGIAFIFLFHIKILKNIKCKKDFALRFALILYLFIYQMQGGYFTDPIIWIFYGVIQCEGKLMLTHEGREY